MEYCRVICTRSNTVIIIEGLTLTAISSLIQKSAKRSCSLRSKGKPMPRRTVRPDLFLLFSAFPSAFLSRYKEARASLIIMIARHWILSVPLIYRRLA
ncbi:hypothetical protein ANTPLA_LOCUS2201 [Anthophora plagiata]